MINAAYTVRSAMSETDYGGKPSIKKCILSLDLRILSRFKDLAVRGKSLVFSIF